MRTSSRKNAKTNNTGGSGGTIAGVASDGPASMPPLAAVGKTTVGTLTVGDRITYIGFRFNMMQPGNVGTLVRRDTGPDGVGVSWRAEFGGGCYITIYEANEGRTDVRGGWRWLSAAPATAEQADSSRRPSPDAERPEEQGAHDTKSDGALADKVAVSPDPEVEGAKVEVASGAQQPNGTETRTGTASVEAGHVTDGETTRPASPPVPPEPQGTSKASSTLATWGDKLEAVHPDALHDHPLWLELAGPASPEREEELIDDVRDGQVTEIVVVAGDGCANPGAILRGTRYVHAVVAARGRAVLVVRRRDLSQDDEEILLIKWVLAGRHSRKLKPSQLAKLEERLHTLYAKRKGFRTDLHDNPTCVGSNAGSSAGPEASESRRPDLAARVAKATGETRNSVASRKKVFGSPVSHLALREGVDADTVTLTDGAAIIRKIEADPAVADVLRQAEDEEWNEDRVAQNPTIQAARSKVEAQVREKLGKPKKKPPAKPDVDTTTSVESPGRVDGDSLILDCLFRQRRTRVTVKGRVVRIEDLGRDGKEGKKDKAGAAQ